MKKKLISMLLCFAMVLSMASGVVWAANESTPRDVVDGGKNYKLGVWIKNIDGNKGEGIAAITDLTILDTDKNKIQITLDLEEGQYGTWDEVYDILQPDQKPQISTVIGHQTASGKINVVSNALNWEKAMGQTGIKLFSGEMYATYPDGYYQIAFVTDPGGTTLNSQSAEESGDGGRYNVIVYFQIQNGQVLPTWKDDVSLEPTGTPVITLAGTVADNDTGNVNSQSENITLTVTGVAAAGTNATLSYKWFKDDVELVANADYTMADNVLTITRYDHTKAGTYRVEVYNTEAGKTATKGTQDATKTLNTVKIAQPDAVTVSVAGKTAATVTLNTATGGNGTGAYEYYVFPKDTTDPAVGTPVSGPQSTLEFAGLTANTDYVAFAKRLGDEDYLDKWSDGAQFRTELAQNDVTLTVAGDTKVGSVLTATPTPEITADRNPTYKWWRSGAADGTGGLEITGANGSTYTLTTADEGSYIYATVEVADRVGVVKSNVVGPIAAGDQGVTTPISYDKAEATYGDKVMPVLTAPVFTQTGTITYAAQPADVVTLNPTTGEITDILKAGNLTITATNTVAGYGTATSQTGLTVKEFVPEIELGENAQAIITAVSGSTVEFYIAPKERADLMDGDGVQLVPTIEGANQVLEGTPTAQWDTAKQAWKVTATVKADAATNSSAVLKLQTAAIAEKITQSNALNLTIQVGARTPLTITANPQKQTKVYNAAVQAFEVEKVAAGVVELGTANYTISYYNEAGAPATPQDVGVYNVVITPVGTYANQYAAAGTTTNSPFQLEITKADQQPLTQPEEDEAQRTSSAVVVKEVTGGSTANDVQYALFPAGTTKDMVVAGLTPTRTWSTDRVFRNLAANTSYVVVARKLGDNNYKDVYSEVGTVQTAKQDITGIGNILINGDPKVNETLSLTINPADLANNGAEIKWYWTERSGDVDNGTEIPGAAGRTYTLTGDVLGKYIFARLTNPNYAGTLTSATVGPVTSGTQSVTGALTYPTMTFGQKDIMPATYPVFSPAGTLRYVSSDPDAVSVDPDTGKILEVKQVKAGVTITVTNTVANVDDLTSTATLNIQKASVTVSAENPISRRAGETVTVPVTVAGLTAAELHANGVTISAAPTDTRNILDGAPAVAWNDGEGRYELTFKISDTATPGHNATISLRSTETDNIAASSEFVTTITVTTKDPLTVEPEAGEKQTHVYDAAEHPFVPQKVSAGAQEITDYTLEYYTAEGAKLQGAPVNVGVYNVVIRPGTAYSTAFEQAGSITNSPYQVEITKATQDALGAPAANTVASTTVELTEAADNAQNTGTDIEYALFAGSDTNIDPAAAQPVKGWQTDLSFTGLTAGTDYVVFARKLGGQNYFDTYSTGVTFRTELGSFTGTARIDGTKRVGELLTFVVEGGTIPAGAEIKWYVADSENADGTEIGTGETYTPTAADAERYIYAVMTSPNHREPVRAASVLIQKGIQQVLVPVSYPDNPKVGDILNPTGPVFSPANGTLSFESSAPDVAEVDPDTGVVTVKKPGDFTITVTNTSVAGYEDQTSEATRTAGQADVLIASDRTHAGKYGTTVEIPVSSVNARLMNAAGVQLVPTIAADADSIFDGQPTAAWDDARGCWIVSIALVNDPALKGKIGELSLVTTAVAGSFDASNTLLTQVVVTDKDPVTVTVGEQIQTVTYSGLPQFYQIDAVDANGTALTENTPNGYEVKYYDLVGNAVAEPNDAGTYNVVIETLGTAADLAGHAGNTVGSPYQLVIEPAQLTVSGISKDYDGTTALGNALTKLAGVTLDGFVNGESGLTVAGFSGTFAAAAAGATTFELGAVQIGSAGGSAKEGNYTVQTGRVQATINKVTPTLTLGNLTQRAGSVTAVTVAAAPAGTANDTAQILVEYEVGGVWKTFQDANLNSITTDSSIPVRASIPAETENFNATGYVTGTLSILGASNPNPNPGTVVIRTWTVTFESNGGTTIEALQVTRGSRITLTQKPEKPGYTFVGWCTDKELTNRVTSLTVNANTILYAEWSADGSAHAAYLTGYGNGIFAPDAKLTRAEAVTILYRLTDETFSGQTLSFTDVKPGAWYYDAVIAMASAGYVYGYPDDTFRPDEPITRAEFAAMLSRYTSANPASISYSDVKQDAWYATSIGKVTQLGWMIGRDADQFHPEANLTRAETAAALNRVLGRSADRGYISQNSINPYYDVSASHWAFYDIVEASVNHLFATAASGAAENWTSVPTSLDAAAIGSSGNYIP